MEETISKQKVELLQIAKFISDNGLKQKTSNLAGNQIDFFRGMFKFCID